MTGMQHFLDRWADGEAVTLDEFGGADRVLSSADQLVASDPLSVVEIVCEYWDSFVAEKDRSIQVLVGAADFNHPDMDAVHDVLLANNVVLSVVAAELVDAVSVKARSDGLYGDIATETWTRLAIGDWCPSLDLRGHLQRRAREAGETTSIHLVRSVGAAVMMWNDKDLVTTLSILGTLDEFEADVHFELAMHQLGLACAASDDSAALEGLQSTIDHLRVTERWDRLDARAYLVPLEALVRFAAGGKVTADDVSEAGMRISEYMIGYRGLRRHWRQGHADVTAGWAHLLRLLTEASAADEEHWFAPSEIISSVASLYVAELSIELVARLGAPSPEGLPGVNALVRPRLVASFSDHPPAAAFLDQWLSSHASNPQGSTGLLVDAVASLRMAVVHYRGTADPKDVRGSAKLGRSVETSTYDEALIADMLSARRQPTYHELGLTRRIIDDISRIVPNHVRPIRPQVASLVLCIVQFTAHMLNQPQDARKALPFLGATVTESGKAVVEEKLRDALCTWLIAAGLNADPEPQAVAGGRADIRISFPEAVFYIEVKRVLSPEDDARAAAHYGNQAAQYAVTSAPITFLALLDYGYRKTRLDLESVIWTASHSLPDIARPYALTGIRIQANVATPSAATREFRVGGARDQPS